MKKDIHPKYYPNAKVICSCGAEFTVGSTLPEVKIEICSLCHPFFTGQEKLIDTEGRLERFEKRQKTAAKMKEVKARKKAVKTKKKEPRPKTLKEMLKRT